MQELEKTHQQFDSSQVASVKTSEISSPTVDSGVVPKIVNSNFHVEPKKADTLGS